MQQDALIAVYVFLSFLSCNLKSLSVPWLFAGITRGYFLQANYSSSESDKS